MEAHEHKASSATSSSTPGTYPNNTNGRAAWKEWTEDHYEEVIQSRLASLLHYGHGWEVTEEVSCWIPLPVEGGYGRGRVDIHATLTPLCGAMRREELERRGIRTIAFEVKRSKKSTSDLTSGSYQATGYMMGFNWRKGGRPYNRPDTVLLVTAEFLLPDLRPEDMRPEVSRVRDRLWLVDRFMWKRGCSVLKRHEGDVGFETNLGQNSTTFIPLFTEADFFRGLPE